MNKRAVFKELLDKFETEDMRLYCEDMIEQIPDYIFTMPSSTSIRFHNATQCKPHGQVYHIVMFGKIMNYLWNSNAIRKSSHLPYKEML